MEESLRPKNKKTLQNVSNEAEKGTENPAQSLDNTSQPLIEVSTNREIQQTEYEKLSNNDGNIPEGEDIFSKDNPGLESNSDGVEINMTTGQTCIKKRIAGFRDVVKNLTRAEVKEFENNPFPTNIRIDQTSGIITVEGWQESVSDVEEVLKRKLREIQKLNEDAKELYEQVRWHYRGISGEERYIEDYDELMNFAIETGYQVGKDCVTLVDVEGVKSVLRFDTMMEYIENDENDQVEVWRSDLTVKYDESVTTDSPSDQDEQMTQTENPRVVSADVMIADELFYELPGLESQPDSVVESQTEVTVDPRNLKLEDEYSKSRIDSYRDLVVNLTKEEVKELENMHAFANIKIDRTNGFVTLDGPLRDVSKAERRILTKLRHIQRKRMLDIELKTPDTIVKWFFQKHGPGEERFIEYQEHINVAIEASYRNLKDDIRLFDEADTVLVIDFVYMVERDENQRFHDVKVIRKVIQSTLTKL